jgi:hypothetical protein
MYLDVKDRLGIVFGGDADKARAMLVSALEAHDAASKA